MGKYYLVVLCGRNLRTSLGPPTAGKIPAMSELLHVLDAIFERGPQSLNATTPSTIVPSALTTRPCPVRLKRTGTSPMVSHTQHNGEPILGRNNSPLGWLHLALAYRYYFCMEVA